METWATNSMTQIRGSGPLVSFVMILSGFLRRLGLSGGGRQVTAEALRRSERRLHDYAAMASAWLWELDADLRFTMVGIDAPPDRTGIGQHIGSHPWDVAGAARSPEKWEQHRLDLMNRRSFRDFRYSRLGQDGRLRHVSINGTPVFDDAGGFLGYRGTGHDITEQVEAEVELRLTKERAESAIRAKSAFLAQMSHELRTPLNAILGFSELILDQAPGPLDERCVEYTREIQQSGHRLLAAVNDLIAMSQLESGSYALKEEHVAVERIIQACLCGAGIAARKANVRIETSDQTATVTLRADTTALVQALLNVLTNAVKFTPAGGNVSWRAEIAASGELVFVVKDTGIGIDQAALPRIFEPFYQADLSNTRRFSGSGLGLAISRKLVMLHGGSLEVQSRPGHGTTVQITLPAERVLGGRRQAAMSASPSVAAGNPRPRSAASRSVAAANLGVVQTSRADVTDGF